MDRVDRSLVPAVDQVLHDRVADLAVLGGGADHRDRIRLHDAVHRGDDLVLARPVTRRLQRKVDDDADIRRGRPVLCREDRVEVHLGDFGEVADETRHLLDHVGERRTVDRIGASRSLQHLGRLDAVEH